MSLFGFFPLGVTFFIGVRDFPGLIWLCASCTSARFLSLAKLSIAKGRIMLMKLSEACSIKADGRACQAANSEAETVISRA